MRRDITPQHTKSLKRSIIVANELQLDEETLNSLCKAAAQNRAFDLVVNNCQRFCTEILQRLVNNGYITRQQFATLPEKDLPQLTGTTIPDFGRRFYIYAPSTILKLGTDDGEAVMTALAHKILGKFVPNVSGLVRIANPPYEQGMLLERQPGIPLVELWPTLDLTDQAKVTRSLVDLLVRMREPREELNYYGRPNGQPYVTPSEFGPHDTHPFCHTYQEWNASRARALHNFAGESGIDEARIQELDQVQQETFAGKTSLSELPVLTHGDLSDRNILIDPSTLQVTGLIDWELANVAPAYFEYAVARLSGGHDPSWRKVLLEVLRQVLRIECDRALYETDPKGDFTVSEKEDLFADAMAAWNSLVNVERSAQGYSDACYWTFQEGG
ncbi:unnamed protein product [Aureobasidium vineae]|uniref:Aminoglycoside phosphotransferase domain-containing protein n=1 Tax=Aureobasidium vineae TaxID=2773715 RepID=A0A9N8PAI7_9PEZI|nr:unnamed protein product [Aureobasidium vineae]